MEGEVTSNAEFVSKVAAISNVEPRFPADFLQDTKIAPTEGQATPTKLKLTFALPHQVLMSNTEVWPRECRVALNTICVIVLVCGLKFSVEGGMFWYVG